MTRKLLSLVFALLLVSPALYAQSDTLPDYVAPPPDNTHRDGEGFFKPTLGLGAGMFTFYGDYSRNFSRNHPMTSRIGFDLRVTQPLNSWLDGSFYVLVGKLGANERSLDRNLNFESSVTIGGINVSYNFDHLYKNKTRVFEPYISLGFESFEYLSKTDLVDAYGNTYNYWTDGSIRNLPEDDPEAGKAIRIQRDFVYETDVRESNLDGFGKYPERSWAVPVGVGGNLIMSDKWKFRVGTSLHYALTDFVDGVTDESVGVRAGDKRNDMFVFTSFNLNFNLVAPPGGHKTKYDPKIFEGAETWDADGDDDLDGVKNIEDWCPNNPIGVEVNENGCPKDTDGDGVPDYKDGEVDTPPGAIVDSVGVALTEAQLEQMYLAYSDSTGAYNTKTTRTEHVSQGGKRTTSGGGPRYVVTVGEFTGPVPADFGNYLLSLPDLEVLENGDTTRFIVGNYDNLPDAVKRKLQLIQSGIYGTGGAIAYTDNSSGQDDFGYVQVPEGSEELQNIDMESAPTDQVVYRVQVGAFTRKLSTNVFADVPQVLAISSEDGLTRYMSGSFTSFSEAAKRKVDLVAKGFPSAFVVPFKNGKRIRLAETGEATIAADFDPNAPVQPQPAVARELVKFRVQVGAYKNEVPTDVLDQLIELGSVEKRYDRESEVTKYVVGTFANYSEALRLRDEIVGSGMDGAFVVGEFDGRIISSREALDLIK